MPAADEWAFLPPLVAGVVLTLGGTLLVQLVQSRRDDKREERSRNLAESDHRKAAGETAAGLVLDDITQIQLTSIDGVHFDGTPWFRYEFDRQQLTTAKAHARAITNGIVRDTVTHAINMLNGLGPAIENGSIEDANYEVQRSLLHHAELVAGAYLRGDDLPAGSMGYVAGVFAKVEAAWKDEIEDGRAQKA